MRIRNFVLTLVLFIGLGYVASAVPADRTPITIKQINGKSLTFVLQGDERIHWAVTLDNYTLLVNNGRYVYAKINEAGDLVPTSILASNEEERSEAEIRFLDSIGKGLFFSKAQVEEARNRFDSGQKKN